MHEAYFPELQHHGVLGSASGFVFLSSLHSFGLCSCSLPGSEGIPAHLHNVLKSPEACPTYLAFSRGPEVHTVLPSSQHACFGPSTLSLSRPEAALTLAKVLKEKRFRGAAIPHAHQPEVIPVCTGCWGSCPCQAPSKHLKDEI